MNILLKNGTLINGTSDFPLEKAWILIQEGMITGVGQKEAIKIPEEVKEINCEGKTILPGLIDAHLHLNGWRTNNSLFEQNSVPDGVKLLRASVDAQNLLKSGFTTVKDCASLNAIHIKKAIAEGIIQGPRILVSNFMLSVTGGHGDDEDGLPLRWAKERNPCICDGIPECMKAARYALREGADFIKVASNGAHSKGKFDQIEFTLEEIKAIVQVAQNAGTFVSSHAQGNEPIKLAIEGGVKTIDHVFYPDDDSIEIGIKKDVIFVPTFAIINAFLKSDYVEIAPEWLVKRGRELWENYGKTIAKIKDFGGVIAMATDYFLGSTIMGTNAIELEYLVDRANFTPLEAIKSATLGGAKACSLEDKIGTLEEGKIADIIIVNGNPLENIKIMQNPERIQLVMKEGNIVVNRGL